MKRSVQREMRTIEAMIRIYCTKHHQKDLCKECGAVLTYAFTRIEKCVFGPGKPACNKCSVHCYSNTMREKMIEIMRFSGPKMIFKHPIMALIHSINEKQVNHSINQQINK